MPSHLKLLWIVRVRHAWLLYYVVFFSIRDIIQKGGEWRQSIGAQIVELSHQVCSQHVVHQRHSQVLSRGQQVTVVCALKV